MTAKVPQIFDNRPVSGKLGIEDILRRDMTNKSIYLFN